jgi:putative restriction endonuclease
MALVLASLASPELVGLIHGTMMQESSATPHDSELKGIVEWEQEEAQKIVTNGSLSETERVALIKARRGQGLFRQRVSQIEFRCRITGVTNPEHLIASHIKPWRESNNDERLATTNGLLLTPTVDHLFDRGFISFENDGELIVSPIAHLESLNRMGIVTSRKVNVGSFVDSQKEFLEFHRSEVFLKSA